MASGCIRSLPTAHDCSASDRSPRATPLQREVQLRHYDVKLLNFFLATPPLADRDEAVDGAVAGGEVALHFGCGGSSYRFHVPAAEPSLCKLADFGTSDIAPQTLGQPISGRQLTTLENTPPDFLLLGTAATQDYAADAFALGLCWLHLLTGRAPYEEVLEAVTCPAELREALRAVWCAPDKSKAKPSPYKPLRELIEADEEESVLFATLCAMPLVAVAVMTTGLPSERRCLQSDCHRCHQ